MPERRLISLDGNSKPDRSARPPSPTQEELLERFLRFQEVRNPPAKAKELIEHFGTFAGIIAAPDDAVRSVADISPTVLATLRVVNELAVSTGRPIHKDQAVSKSREEVERRAAKSENVTSIRHGVLITTTLRDFVADGGSLRYFSDESEQRPATLYSVAGVTLDGSELPIVGRSGKTKRFRSMKELSRFHRTHCPHNRHINLMLGANDETA